MSRVADVVVSKVAVRVTVRDLDPGADVGDGVGAPVATSSAPLADDSAPEETFQRAWLDVGSPQVDAIHIAGDDDALVLLDAHGEVIRPTQPWSEIDTTPDAGWLLKQLPGGAEEWVEAAGGPPTAEMPIAKLSWLHRSEPEAWARLAHVFRGCDVLAMRLAGLAPSDVMTDRASAAASGYWSPSTEAYRWDLLAIVDRDRDWRSAVPRVAADGGVGEVVGDWNGARVVVGSSG